MNDKEVNTDHVQQETKSIGTLMYERNQAYAFIVMNGLALDFLAFIQEKQCEQTTNDELKLLLELYNPKKNAK